MGIPRPHHATALPGPAQRRASTVLALFSVLALILAMFMTPPRNASAAEDPSAVVSLSLSYGDNQSHPSGVTVHPGKSFSGNINVNMTDKPATTINDLTVTLKVPKKNVNGISVPEFADKAGTHTISSMTTDGDDDVITIHWDTFNPASGLQIPFTVSVANGQTPEGFVIHPAATISSKQNPTPVSCDPLIAVAHYPDLKLSKSSNGQTGEAMVVGAVSTATTAGGTEYIPENGAALVAFTFSLSAEDNSIRSMSKVVLTDELPSYTDHTGTTRQAAFSAAANPGWTLSGTTLTWTNTGDSNTLASSIPTLKIAFPGLPLTESGSYTQEDGATISYKYGTASNTATLTTTVADPEAGETGKTASATLDLELTTDDTASRGQGFLTVEAYRSGNYDDLGVTDTMAHKKADFQWRFYATNKLSYAMNNVALHDEPESTLCGTGSDACGPDSRLRATGLSDIHIGSLASGKILQAIKEIHAYKEDGSYDTYTLSDASGSPAVTFDSTTVYTGFSVVFDPDWVWEPGVEFSLTASSYLRDPDTVHYTEPSTASSNKIINRAAVIGSTLAETIGSDGNVALTPIGTSYSRNSNNYRLTKFTEKLSVGVEFYYTFMGARTQSIGGKPLTDIRIGGTLDPGKDYSNLRAVALLPAGMVWKGYGYTACVYGAPAEGCSSFVTGTSAIDNYKGTGRTAVIFSLDQAYAKKFMDGSSNAEAWLYFTPEITQDSTAGTEANVLTAFLTSDNAPDPGSACTYSTCKTPLPSVNGVGAYPDTYHIGHHNTITAASYAYTVTMNAGMVGSQTIESSTAKDSTGIIVDTGDTFTYHLSVSDFGEAAWSDLSLFDALPTTNPDGKYGTSKYAVHLSAFPTAPAGYTLLYATAPSVATMTEAQATADSSLWVTQDKISDPGKVTAIRLVAKSGTTVQPNATVSLNLPMQATAGAIALPSDSDYTTNTTGNIGLIALRDATNTFSYSAKQGTVDLTWKQSNPVYARLDPYAGFVVKKVSGFSAHPPLAGATLAFSDGTTQTTTDTGTLAYYTLQAGTYTLAEDKAPAGYLKAAGMTITVVKTGTTLQMTCTTKSASGSSTTCTGAGTQDSPFIITDPPITVSSMPGTGGRLGTLILAIAVTLLLALLAASSCVLLRTRRREH